MRLVKKIQNTIFQQKLFARGDKIIVGVSGGPDSVCLLDILAKLAPKYNLKLAVAHVNYGLRGKESDGDEKFVRKLAKGYGFPIFTLTPSLSLKRERGRTVPSENKMRDVRYDFFERLRQKNNFDLTAVAHNADDQVETFLMRIIRGAGLSGLSAMKFKNGKIIRPLLGTFRKEILKYLKTNKLKWRNDKTNLENLYFRNKIRNQMIPYLEKNFNPAIKKTIFDATVSIAEDQSLLDELKKKNYIAGNPFSAKKILKLHPALQRRILLKKIEEIRGGKKDIELAHVEEMLKALKSTKGKAQTVIFKGLKMLKKGDKVTISRNA